MHAEMKQALVDIVGEENFTDRLIDMISYSYDASEHTHRPSCAVWAETAQQVSEILKLANGSPSYLEVPVQGFRAWRFPQEAGSS